MIIFLDVTRFNDLGESLFRRNQKRNSGLAFEFFNFISARYSLANLMPPCFSSSLSISALCKCRRPVWHKYLFGRSLWNAVRERKFKILCQELFDVWALNVVGLFNFDDLEDLDITMSASS